MKAPWSEPGGFFVSINSALDGIEPTTSASTGLCTAAMTFGLYGYGFIIILS